MTTLDWHAERSDLAGLELLDQAPESLGIDLNAVRLYRMGRVRSEMAKRSIDALIISDPVNIRYASGARNMQVFCARNTPSRYLLMTATKNILFEFTGCEHLGQGFATIDEVRPSSTASFVAAGPNIQAREKRWAQDMLATIREITGPSPVIGMERMNAGTSIAMAELGVQIVDAQESIEMARCIKSSEELKCVVASLRATERAVGRLRDAIRPGITENQLWSVLHQSVIAENGDYCETRLLSSGHRTNPWFQESNDRAMAAGDFLAFDTDLITRNRALKKVRQALDILELHERKRVLRPELTNVAEHCEAPVGDVLEVLAGVGQTHAGHTFAKHVFSKLELTLDGFTEHLTDVGFELSVKQFGLFGADGVHHFEGEVHVA